MDYGFKTRYVPVPAPPPNLKIVGCKAPERGFEIQRFEVTNTEYASFLNAVARESDPQALYSPLMSQHFWGGILRREDHGRARYFVRPGYERLPVTFVSWLSAARYANWLAFGRPDTGRSEFGTTEGNHESGAYNTSALRDGTPGERNPEAPYFIPTCGEWIYSAFFNPATGQLQKYIGGDKPPMPGPPKLGSRTANYYAGAWALPFPHLSSVDQYENNKSAFGTLNQSGNVMEWVETTYGRNQMALGGSVSLPQDTLTSDYRDSRERFKEAQYVWIQSR